MARVLVIIPAYNEAESIGNVLEALRSRTPEYSVVVVDDGSTDNTAAVARQHEGVDLVRLPYSLGIGGAMQTGYKYAVRHAYDVAVQCDADGQHPVAQLRSLVERLAQGDADLVIGSRYVADTAYLPSFTRRVGKSILSRLVDVVVGEGITDTTSGFRAASRRAFSLFARRYPDDYPEAEALVILHKSGLRPVEMPVEMSPRQGGKTSISPKHAVYYMIKVGLAIFVDVFRKFTKASEEL